MGKLLCESSSCTTVENTIVTPPQPLLTWHRDPQPQTTNTQVGVGPISKTCWDDVSGLEDQQRKSLSRLFVKGVLWKHPQGENDDNDHTHTPLVFKLAHGGDVEADGNCLFSSAYRAMGGEGKGGEREEAREMRRRAVRRFEEDVVMGNGDVIKEKEKENVEVVIKNLYCPDLKCGWGIHVVQEVKLLAKKSDRQILDGAILQLVNLGMQRELAAESIYKERCTPVDDGPSWVKYMSVSGCPDDEYDIITLQYTEEGLLTVDENREGRAAAFGDDIAIECLATEYGREIYVVQAHGSDAMVDEDNCVFFLPHRPRGQITGPPFFLFMKGTGWCGAGGDHYEPLIAHPSPLVSQEKVGFVL